MAETQGWVAYLWVGLGGFLGANARSALGGWLAEQIGTTFPAGTLVINVTGSLVIGVLLVLLTERLAAPRPGASCWWWGSWAATPPSPATPSKRSPSWRQALGRAGGWYVLGSNGWGLAACYAGIVLARLLPGGR